MIFNKNKKVLTALISLIILIINIFMSPGCIEKQQNNEKSEELSIRIGIESNSQNITLPNIPNFQEYSPEKILPIANMYNTLVDFDEKYKIIPSLAESWYNPDNVTWRFYLRNDVEFHNGYDFSAEDVRYTIEKLNHSRLSIIEQIKVVDNYTMDIITTEPTPMLLNYLTQVCVISKKYHEETSNSYPVGTGPYMFNNYSNGNSITLKKFNNYWKYESLFDSATFKFYYTYEEKIDAFNSGYVDLIDELNPADYERLRRLNNTKVINISRPNIYYLSFNFQEHNSYWNEEVNPVSNVSVRKAIYHAIDVTPIIEELNNYMLVAPLSQIVNSNIIGHNPDIERLEYNISKALQYMRNAGYEQGFEIELDSFNVTIMKNISSIIVDQLEKINISVKLNNLSFRDLITKLLDRNSSFYIIGWQMESADAMEIFNDILRSVDEKKGYGTSNYGYYSNDEIDNIAEGINKEMNDKIRISLMQEGFKIAHQDVVYIPIFECRSSYAFCDYLNFTPRADSIITIDEITLS